MTEKEIRLVEENVPLAGYVAKRWVKQAGIEWEDALSAAEYGLVKAAMSFEEGRGFCFSTYAVRVMENEIRMELRKRNRRKKVVYFGDPVSGAEGLTLGDTIADAVLSFINITVSNLTISFFDFPIFSNSALADLALLSSHLTPVAIYLFLHPVSFKTEQQYLTSRVGGISF